MNRPVASMVWLACAGLMLAACTHADDQPRTQAQATTALRTAWSIALQPLSGVREIGGVAVLYAKFGDQIRIHAYDPATGRRLWSDTASPAAVARGIPLTVREMDNKVVYYQDASEEAGDLFARLVVADPKTGKQLQVTSPRFFTDPAETCPDDETAVCSTAWDPRTNSFRLYRLAQHSNRLVPAPAAQSGADLSFPNRRTIGPDGLVDLEVRDPEWIGVIKDGAIAWKARAEDLFAPGFSTDQGWNFGSYGKDDVFVGSIGSHQASTTADGATTLDLAGGLTVGFRMSDGKVLWRAQGTWFECLDATDLTEDGEQVPLRCRYEGTVTTFENGAEPKAQGISVTVERFDLKTGRAIWSTPVGNAPALAAADADSRHASFVDANHLAFMSDGRPLLLDVKTGSARPAPASTRTWCRPESTINYKQALSVTDSDGEEHVTRRVSGAGVVFPCNLAGQPILGSMTGAPDDVASFDDALRVYAAPGHLVGLQPVPGSAKS